MQELQRLGIREVQVHEPILVTSEGKSLQEAVEQTYRWLASVGIPLHLVTYFDDLGETYPWAVELPVAGLSLDFTRGHNLELVRAHGFPADKILGAGVVDGRNVWQIQPKAVLATLQELQALAPNLRVQPSCSLQFVPHDAALETHLPEPLRNVLSFAEQKLAEVVLLARTLNGEDTAAQQQELEQQWQAFQDFNPPNSTVRQALANLTAQDFQRSLPYEQRIGRQVKLPPLPTTTIGSFPQTPKSGSGGSSTKRARSPRPNTKLPSTPKLPSASASKKKLAWMCWCMVSSSAPTWWNTSPNNCRALPLPSTAGCRAMAAAACVPHSLRRRVSPSPHDGAGVQGGPISDSKAGQGDADRAGNHAQLVLPPR